MSFTTSDYELLQKIMNESPENRELLQKLLDSHQYTISKISHEIRNPLALVYSTLQLIESQHPEAKDFKHWTQMREDIEFMISLLQELSSYNNGERLHLERFSSYEFLGRICLSFAASCEEYGITFSSQIPSDLPEIKGDRIKLKEVILNLLKNAKEAVSSNGQITLNACVQNNTLNILISDNGCGIPSEYMETLFDAFVTHKPDGTGLGLAIAKKTLLAHGGNITVESVPSEGTCFTISLPVT